MAHDLLACDGQALAVGLADREHECRFPRHPVQFRSAAGQHEPHLPDARRRGQGPALSVAGRADHGPAGAATDRRDERPHDPPPGPAHTVLPDRCAGLLSGPAGHALQPGAVVRRRPAVDPGRREQRDHGALPGLRQRPAPRGAACKRLPHPGLLHRPGADPGLSDPQPACGRGHQQGHARRQRHSGRHHAGIRDRRAAVVHHRLVVHPQRARTSVAGPGDRAAEGLAERFRAGAGRGLGRAARHAVHDAPAVVDGTVPVVRNDVLLDLHRAHAGGHGVRHGRPEERRIPRCGAAERPDRRLLQRSRLCRRVRDAALHPALRREMGACLRARLCRGRHVGDAGPAR
mmetsp:Transcript_5215/g.19482  ORF Transcript_5215/g.19482 Transcript_5215/m.19482 type:complete len:346 (+) Transcript_5215:601-1638(+)